MRTLIVYDSQFGNTEKIARAIGEAVGGEAEVVHANQADPTALAAADLVIVGAPTQGGRATPPVRDLLKRIKRQGLKNKPAAAFDTRISAKWVGLFGYAAGRIGKELMGKGATLVVAPEPFFVTSDKVPQLPEAELERAAAWARKVASKIS
jgi:flavodoxin I